MEVFTQARLDDLLARATTLDELDRIEALWNEARECRRLAAQARMRHNTVAFLRLIGRMADHVEVLARAPVMGDAAAVTEMRAGLADLHARFHGPEALRKTFAATDGLVEVVDDEKAAPTDATPEPPPPPGPVLETPTPLNSTRYVALADEYVRLFGGAEVRKTHRAKVEALADRALANKARYVAVEEALGVPWWFTAGVHMMESTFNFAAHLHNGDPLTRRTTRVPAGRPADGAPPYTWERSAADAFALQRLGGLTDWSLPRALWRWERYNGFGYRGRGIATPYLWSFSSIYLRGKYVADGRFDGAATSSQCGVAVLLKALTERGEVTPMTDVVAERESGLPEPPPPAPAPSAPHVDRTASGAHPFEAFCAANLGGLKHFGWREFLFKGASHDANGLNTDPPEDLWPNIVPLARALDALREAMGKPVRLTSVYRSPAYNARLSGSAARSRHMAFQAADLQVIGADDGPRQWAERLRALRTEGLFQGGIGVYGSFVHVDTRGEAADWSG